MRSALLIASLLTLSLSAIAQQDGGAAASAFRAKRLPPEKSNASANNTVSTADVQDTPELDSVKKAANDVRQPASASAPVPAGFKPKTDVQLTKTAEEAVQMSEKWMAEHNAPAVGRDGRVLYSYGAGLPTVVCAPLRVCIIELQSGESLVGEPHIGDSVRWNISPAVFGHGDSATAVIVLKPQSSGLDTNLLITTDRRAYYVRLLSKPGDYVARVAFAYPDDEEHSARWRDQVAKQKQQEQKAVISELSGTSIESLFFDYAVKGKDESLKPVRVFDDGQNTFIQIGRETQTREAPILVVLGRDGKQDMVTTG